MALNGQAAYAEGGGFGKYEFGEFGFFVGVGQDSELNAWAAFFHDDGGEEGVARTGFEQAVDEVAVNFRVHVVDICFEQDG